MNDYNLKHVVKILEMSFEVYKPSRQVRKMVKEKLVKMVLGFDLSLNVVSSLISALKIWSEEDTWYKSILETNFEDLPTDKLCNLIFIIGEIVLVNFY